MHAAILSKNSHWDPTISTPVFKTYKLTITKKEFISSSLATGNNKKINLFLLILFRVADDHYFVYSALTSGPQTLFVSNDLLGNHIDKYPQLLQPIFKKWQRSSQVHFTNDQPVAENIKVNNVIN